MSTLTTTQTVSLSFLIVNQGVTPFAPVIASGGTAPVSYSISPDVFAGLYFNPSTGYISGAPNALSDFVNYTITVADGGVGPNLQTAVYSFNSVVTNRISTSVAIENKTLTATIPSAPFIPITATGGYGQYRWSIFPTIPDGLKFNSFTGAISGAAKSGNTTTNYTISVTDQTTSPNEIIEILERPGVARNRSAATFNLTILPFKDLAVPQPWETTGTIGTVYPGEISELYVKGRFSTSTVYANYSLISGSLPAGLTLNQDGTISGRVEVNTAITTGTSTSSFVIAVDDTNNNNLLNGQFSVTVNQTDSTLYTEIYCRPFLSQDKRSAFIDFIRDDTIFIPNLLYRAVDPNFGRQEELKLVIDFGVKRETLRNYAEFISINFYRRSVSLGEIKTAVARNIDGTVRHELIYINVIDKHVNSDKISIPKEIIFNGSTYYPPSIPNMRAQLASETTLTTIRNPSFTDSVQAGESVKPGYKAFVPLCFTLPGKSPTIIRKINESGFKFNTFNFEIDRIIVQNALEQIGAKYLLLPRNSRLA
jgi:hypothetical protein